MGDVNLEALDRDERAGFCEHGDDLYITEIL